MPRAPRRPASSSPRRRGSVLKAGGVDLVDHLKEHLVEPPRVVDLKTIRGVEAASPQVRGVATIGGNLLQRPRARGAASAEAAGKAAVLGAEPMTDNGYKVDLVTTLVRRTVASLA